MPARKEPSGGSAAPPAGPGLLRHFRRRAELTQFELAERCGVSDRTVRGLETGAIKKPQQTTLRLLAEALALSVREQAHFAAAWGSKRGARWLEGMMPDAAENRAELERQLHEQYGNIREVTNWSRRTMGRDRRAEGLSVRRGFIVEQGCLDTWLFAFGGAGRTRPPVVTATENCRLVTIHDWVDEAWLYELTFDRTLQPGEAYSFIYELEHDNTEDAPAEIPTPTKALVGIAASMPSLTVEVRFHPDALPAGVWQVYKALQTGELTLVAPMALSPFHTVHLVLEHPEPGFYGLLWTWPDD